jgi:hypothetical protein
MDDGQEEMKAQVGSHASRIDVNQEEMKAMLDACLETLEANPEELQSVAVNQEIPKEEVAVEMIRALKDRYLAVGRRRQMKKRTQGDGGSRQNLAATRGRVTCRAIPAPRKGHGRQGPGKDNVVRGTPKGQTFKKRRWKGPECNNGIRDRGLKGQLRLGSKMAFNKTVRQTFGLEVAKRVLEFSIKMRKISDWTLWRFHPLRNERPLTT